MNTFKKGIYFLFALLLVIGCSTNKNKFANRNYHAVTAEYNILYNGNLALEEGREELVNGYTDNYWDILPIERMQVSEEVMLPGQQKNENFTRAEDKAAKAIQKHSMYIDGTEENPQMDEAFLLLGKARYYDQRFIPALEAFNYILHKYPTSNNIAHAKVWREKANIRLENNELAIKNLKTILKDPVSLKEQDIADASAMLSQAYLNLEEIDSALAPIKTAARLTQDNEQKGRYLFIKGQLYNKLGHKDSANLAFDEVIELNRKAPRVYMMNSYIEKARNFDFEKGDKLALRELLQELLEDRENRPFLDILNHQTGEFYRNIDSFDSAIEYYNRSLRTESRNKYLHAQNYVTIGNILFDNKKFQAASPYFDSTLTKLNNNTREYRAIKRKRDNLEDVVLYEGIAAENDSILKVAKLSEEEQLAFFTTYTNRLKEQESIKSKAKEKSTATNNQGPPSINSGGSRASSFYFYNPSSLSYGKLEFKRIYGDIKLADNWKLNPERASKERKSDVASGEDSISIDEDPKYHPGTYIAQIPQTQKEIDSIAKERNYAYFQLGVIYKEKFYEYPLAASKLEFLLQNNPEERLVLPAKYNLYKIYLELGDTAKAERAKQDILNNYPDSRYAKIIENPNSVLQKQNNPEIVYAGLYRKLGQEEYQEVIDSSEYYIGQFNGLEVVPKFELLKARATGRLYGFEEYKKVLNHVAVTYPQSEEGKKAQQLFDTAIPAMAFKNFKEEASDGDFKLVYTFLKSEKEEAIALQEKIKNAIIEQGVDKLKTSIDIYDPQQVFVVVHNLDSALGAEGFAEILATNKKYKIQEKSYSISTSNYQIVQIHKNFEKYIKSK